MNRNKTYTDLKGRVIVLADLDAEERELVDELKSYAAAHPDWNEYGNYWMPKVYALYKARGLTRRETIATDVWRIAQDIGGRIAVAAGLARAPDYRDDLESLISTHFPTRRAFCEATGLSEDMLSHVLAKRKHLAVDTLNEALGRIGYALHIAPGAMLSPIPGSECER
jgi:hypothetical protein